MATAKGKDVQFAEPKVQIIAATEKDPVDAAALLIFTKRTRLEMSPALLDATKQLVRDDPDWAYEELSYMAKTIRSSWEFLDYTFVISNVSRACAQQITRTRHASFAMQSQRVTNMSNVTFHCPETMYPRARRRYVAALEAAMDAYDEFTDPDDPIATLEDARNVLPNGTHCNLVAKYNLRTLADLLVARTSPRAQGEYATVAKLMRQKLTDMHPWVEAFLEPRSATAVTMCDDLVEELKRRGLAEADIVRDVAKIRDMVSGG